MALFRKTLFIYAPGTTAYRNAWQETIKAAEEANEAGRFTAFIGYEWTSNTGANNLHRNVIFRDNGDKAFRVEPYTTFKPVGNIRPFERFPLWAIASTFPPLGSDNPADL